MNNGTGVKSNGSIPRMITDPNAKPASFSTSQAQIPPLPKLTKDFAYGGAWMDPSWKKTLNGYQKLFGGYPIQMAIIVVLAIALAFGGACLKGAGRSADSDAEAPASATTGSSCGGSREDSTKLEVISGTVGTVAIEVLDMQMYTITDGTIGLEIKTSMTNAGTDAIVPYDLIYSIADQGGVELLDYSAEFDEYYDGQMTPLEYGVTREVCFFLHPVTVDGGIVNITICDELQSDVIEFTFDPQAMLEAENEDDGGETEPTAPAFTPVSDTVAGFFIECTGYELFTNEYGSPALRVELNVTNNGEEDSFYSHFSYYAVQDGGDLSEVTSTYEDYHEIISADMPVGTTKTIYIVFHTVNPDGGDVNVYIEDWWDENDYMGFSCPMY